jgi:hypothetical protein
MHFCRRRLSTKLLLMRNVDDFDMFMDCNMYHAEEKKIGLS